MDLFSCITLLAVRPLLSMPVLTTTQRDADRRPPPPSSPSQVHIKARSRVVVLGLAQTPGHYAFVMRKLAIPAGKTQTGQERLTVVDCMSNLVGPTEGAENASGASDVAATKPGIDWTADDPLDGLFDAAASAVGTGEGRAACLVIDDAGLLLDLGAPLGAVLRLISRCRALVGAEGGTLVTLSHDGGEPDLEAVGAGGPRGAELAQVISFGADFVITARGLESGYSRDVHGLLSIKSYKVGVPAPPDVQLHYKTHEKGISFFAPGTSAAVL